MTHAIRTGTTDQIAYFRAYDTDGTAKVNLTSATAGLSLSVFRVGASAVSISSLSDKAADNTAHADGAIRRVQGNLYTIDLPDAAIATQVPSIRVKGTYTGGEIEGEPHPIVGYDGTAARVGASDGTGVTLAADQEVNTTKWGGTDVGSVTLNCNMTQISGDTTAADNAESFFDGTGYAGTNNVIPTVTTVANRVTANTDQWSGVTVTGMPMPTYTQPPGFLAATFPTTVASPTNITAASGITLAATTHTGAVIPTVTSVTNGVTISGTTATLDALQTALNTAHGSGSWATATGFSTHSAADVWAVGTRTITGGSLTTAPPTAAAIADAVWDEARTGHTTAGTFGYYLDAAISGISGGGGGSTASDIWAYATRTLTSTLTITTDDIDAIVAGVTAAGPGLYNVIRNDDLTLRIGDEFTQAITGLGNLSTRDDLVFTLKASETDADTAAKIYLSENDGLTRLNGAAYGTAANGSITVDDATNGDITIRISSAATASLTKATRVDAVKVLESGGNDRTPRVGKTQVLPVIVEARG